MGGSAVLGGVTVRWAVGTDVGLVRKVNEDAAIAKPPVFLVADGMGGHAAGDVASALVVGRFSSLSGETPATSEEIAELIQIANCDVYTAGSKSAGSRSMGTTAVGLALVTQGDDPMWMIFNVGDSRAYRMVGGHLELLSTDHSYVQELVTAGRLGAEEARTHPQRNVVTRAFGVEESVEADLWLRSPQVGERFLLCSDGLSTEVNESEITRHLAEEADPEAAVEKLVRDALSAGGRDNVTVVVIDVVDFDGGADQTTAPRSKFRCSDKIEASATDRYPSQPVPNASVSSSSATSATMAVALESGAGTLPDSQERSAASTENQTDRYSRELSMITIPSSYGSPPPVQAVARDVAQLDLIDGVPGELGLPVESAPDPATGDMIFDESKEGNTGELPVV